MRKKIIISVISDLVTDQRVHKVATTLYNNSYDILLIGAKRKKSKIVETREYKTKRISMFFQKGFLMYAEWNIRLFFVLLFKKADVLLANDLDTLLPNFLNAKLKNKKLVYDSHEYFTEQQEIQGRDFVKKTWLKLEQYIFPKLKNVYTVNNSIAKIYEEKYNVHCGVIRNVPNTNNNNITIENELLLQLKDKKILLSQGSGMNSGRGLEELVQSIQFLPNEYVLVLIGSGLVVEELKKIAKQCNIENRIFFTGILNRTTLQQFTKKAFCGFTLDKDSCLNHLYSLPNKLFDYIAAEIPIIASNMPEVANIITQYNIGYLLNTVTPQLIADKVLQLENNKDDYANFKNNTRKAKNELNWENEESKLMDIFNNVKS